MCKALFLEMEDGVNGVTVLKQGVGLILCDVQKLQKPKGQETHEQIMSFKFLVNLCENGSVKCDYEFQVLSRLEHSCVCIKMVCVCINKSV